MPRHFPWSHQWRRAATHVPQQSFDKTRGLVKSAESTSRRESLQPNLSEASVAREGQSSALHDQKRKVKRWDLEPCYKEGKKASPWTLPHHSIIFQYVESCQYKSPSAIATKQFLRKFQGGLFGCMLLFRSEQEQAKLTVYATMFCIGSNTFKTSPAATSLYTSQRTQTKKIIMRGATISQAVWRKLQFL